MVNTFDLANEKFLRDASFKRVWVVNCLCHGSLPLRSLSLVASGYLGFLISLTSGTWVSHDSQDSLFVEKEVEVFAHHDHCLMVPSC